MELESTVEGPLLKVSELGPSSIQSNQTTENLENPLTPPIAQQEEMEFGDKKIKKVKLENGGVEAKEKKIKKKDHNPDQKAQKKDQKVQKKAKKDKEQKKQTKLSFGQSAIQGLPQDGLELKDGEVVKEGKEKKPKKIKVKQSEDMGEKPKKEKMPKKEKKQKDPNQVKIVRKKKEQPNTEVKDSTKNPENPENPQNSEQIQVKKEKKKYVRKPKKDADGGIVRKEKKEKKIKQKKEKSEKKVKKKKEKKVECMLCQICQIETTELKCKSCRNKYHIACLDPIQVQQFQKQRLCRSCKDQKNLHRKQKRQQMKESIPKKDKPEPSTPKKKSKKEAFTPSKLRTAEKKQYSIVNEFKKNNPFCLNHVGNIQYPIPDHLFLEYPTLTVVPQKVQPTIIIHPFIPNQYFPKILQIWNFFESFWDEIDGPDFSKEELFVALSYHQDQKQIHLVNDIHIALVRLFLDNFKNKDQEVDGFLYLLQCMDDVKEILGQVWPEIVIHMKDFAPNVFEYHSEQIQILETLNLNEYNQLSLDSKLGILSFMMDFAYHLDVIRDHIQGKIEDSNTQQKQRQDLQNDLKSEESYLKEFQTQYKELQTYYDLNQFLDTRQKNRETLDAIQKKQNQIYKTELKIEKLHSKMTMLMAKHHFKLNSMHLVGQDAEKNNYWFIQKDNTYLYVQKDGQWGYIETKDPLFMEFYKSLNPKGIREKKLFDNLTLYLENDFINTEKTQIIETDLEKIQREVFEYNYNRESKTTTKRSNKKPVNFLEDNIKIGLDLFIFKANLKHMETYFSKFLKKRSQTWKKEDLMERLKDCDNIYYFVELFQKITEGFSHVQETTVEDGIESSRRTHLKIWGLPSDSLKSDWDQYVPQIKSLSGILFAQVFFQQVLEKYVQKKEYILKEQQQPRGKLRTVNKVKYMEEEDDFEESMESEEPAEVYFHSRNTRRNKIID